MGKKNPWLAAILNMAFTGLGYIYAETKITFGILLLMGSLSAFTAAFFFGDQFLALLANPLMVISTIVFIIAFGYDAYNEAKGEKHKEGKWEKKLKKKAWLIVLLVVIAIFVSPLVIGFISGFLSGVSSTDYQPTFENFVSEEGGFTILFPESPETTTEVINTLVGEIFSTNFIVQDYGFSYMVTYADYPEEFVESVEDKNSVFDGSIGGMAGSVRGQIVEEKEISLGDQTGKEAIIDGGDFSLKTRVYLVGNRFYLIAVNAIPKERIYENFVNEYLDSFELII